MYMFIIEYGTPTIVANLNHVLKVTQYQRQARPFSRLTLFRVLALTTSRISGAN